LNFGGSLVSNGRLAKRMDGGTGNRAHQDALEELLAELGAVRDGIKGEVCVRDQGRVGEVAALVNQLLHRTGADSPRGAGPVDERLRRQQSVLQYIIDHVPHSIFWKDLEGRFLGGNKNLLRDVGFSSLDQLLGKSDYDLGFPKEQVDHFRKCDLDVMMSGQPLLDIEESQNQADGTHTLLTSKVPLRDDRDQVIGLLGIYVDITERKRIEEELRMARDAAESASRARGEFLTVMSHELRTPLTLILGPLDWMLSRADAALAPEVRAGLERMRRNAGRLLSLVNDILDFTMIEAGQMQVDWESFDVADLVSQLVADAGPAAEQAGLDLRFVAEPDPGFVVLDRRKFEKITLNLLGNALKFTPRGGRVVVAVRAAGDDLELSVTDTGPGIPLDKQGLLFRRFQQIDSSTRRKHEGTGIGLALVKDLADVLGGAAGLESEPGKGSRFFVRIPRTGDRPVSRSPGAGSAQEGRSLAEQCRRISTQLAPAAETHAPPAASVPGAAPRARVLVAEDNPDMQGYLAQILSVEYDVEVVADGRRALEVAQARPPAVIVSDVMMPEVDGLELVWRLKQCPALRQVPVILLTAKASRADLIAGLQLGADDYLGKPFSPEELCARVRAARRLHDSYQELERRHRELESAHAELARMRTQASQGTGSGPAHD
jgi:PAS domain S-box-containing protein